MTNQIAFVHIGSFSHANQQLAQALRQQFPTYTLDMIDIRALIMRQKVVCLRNLRFLVQEYGKELLQGRSFRRSFFATTYMFRQMSALAAQQVAKGKYHFSLQTQSMFDASTPAIDHFVYTDHTVLAHFQYLGFNRRDLAPYLFTPQWIALEKQIYHHATLTFAMSNFVVESIIEDYGCPAHKVVQAYAGGNASLVTPSATKRYDQKNILFVGMDWERKGGPVLAAAFQQLLATHPDATLTIVGCSPKLALPNCRVTGRIPLPEVQQHYDAATVFCLPTKLEPFGFVFIEAMGQKLPIVATRVGAIPDFVQDGKNGYLVDPDDVTGLANALNTMIADPKRCRSMGEVGRRKVEQCYSWGTVARIMKEHIVREKTVNR